MTGPLEVERLLEELAAALMTEGTATTALRHPTAMRLVGAVHAELAGDSSPDKERSVGELVARELARLYRAGGGEERRFLVDTVLEHLLENEAFRRYVESWRDDPELHDGLREAESWADAIIATRSIAAAVAERVLQTLDDSPSARLEDPETGTDVAVITLGSRTDEAATSLVIELSDQLADHLSRQGSVSAEEIDHLASYARDQGNWRQSPDVRREYWVTLPMPSGR